MLADPNYIQQLDKAAILENEKGVQGSDTVNPEVSGKSDNPDEKGIHAGNIFLRLFHFTRSFYKENQGTLEENVKSHAASTEEQGSTSTHDAEERQPDPASGTEHNINE